MPMKSMNYKIVYRRLLAVSLVCMLGGLWVKISHISSFIGAACLWIAALCLLAMLMIFVFQAFFEK